ncbi:MAG: hypothetical protein GC154_17460 [bacterium]|nr:hypothetical protein [bacterium]
MRLLKSDCRHYRGDRPCRPHKERGAVCEGCDEYDPIQTRVLVIKLGATGDVLRTTALLGSIRDLHPAAHITWVTRGSAYPLVANATGVDQPLELNTESLALIDALHFDLCVNFDLSAEACALAMRVSAENKRGFGLSPQGVVTAFSPEAETVIEMSLWDDVKRANQRTYQSLMRSILGAPEVNHPIVLNPPESSRHKAAAFALANGLKPGDRVIGFNVGAGGRWRHKKWTAEGFIELARLVYRDLNAHVLLLHGPDDAEQLQRITDGLEVPAIDAGLWPSLLDFSAILGLCDAVVTGDTFALHAALALGKPVVCMVGPTSARELELYGQGSILQGDVDCLGCYLTDCDKDPYCMQNLPAERVHSTLRGLFGV